MSTCDDCVYKHPFAAYHDKEEGCMHSCMISKEKKKGRRLFVTGKEKPCVDFLSNAEWAKRSRYNLKRREKRAKLNRQKKRNSGGN